MVAATYTAKRIFFANLWVACVMLSPPALCPTNITCKDEEGSINNHLFQKSKHFNTSIIEGQGPAHDQARKIWSPWEAYYIHQKRGQNWHLLDRFLHLWGQHKRLYSLSSPWDTGFCTSTNPLHWLHAPVQSVALGLMKRLCLPSCELPPRPSALLSSDWSIDLYFLLLKINHCALGNSSWNIYR